MKLELINTGTELLLGDVLNTHLVWIARELFPLGLRIERQTCVPDGPAIREAIAETFGRAGIVLVTGGLGPTSDDLTRDVTAGLLGIALHQDERILDQIRERFARRGFQINDRIARQALVPDGAEILWNPHGTAPGLHLPARPGDPAPHLFLLPGPPRELRPMFTDHVVPRLVRIAPASAGRVCRTFRLAGIGESQVEESAGPGLEAVDGLEIGYCARPGEVDVRLLGAADVVARGEQIVREKLGAFLYAEGKVSMEESLIRRLESAGKSLAVAESCTGGLLANRLTNVPGASAVFLAGYVTYSNAAKTSALGVPPGLIAAHGAVSAEVAAAMAQGALDAAGSDFALATTGIAGPSGGSEEKPVGTVFLALAARGGTARCVRQTFRTDRETFKFMATQSALDLLRGAIG